MKKRILCILTACLLLGFVSASAQKKMGMRMEVAEAETDHGEYSIFTYKQENDSIGYYMSLGRTSDFLGADELLGMQVKNMDETVIWLGTTTDDVFSALDNLTALYDKDIDTTAEFNGRSVSGSGNLGEANTVKCMVVKKRLEFLFAVGNRQAHTFLTKSVVKELRMNFKIDVKLHPKRHQKK